MQQPRVWTFFYGSYINKKVLLEVDLIPDQLEVARLAGFDIRIQPLANLVESGQHCVFGIVATCSHEQLGRLYDHAEHVLGGVYLPQAVLCETLDGKLRPALCYLAHSMEPKPASRDYLDRIIVPARQYGFPQWYIERLNRFRSD